MVAQVLASSKQIDQRAHVNQLHFRNIDAACWTDLARLFEERGGPKSCWCMVWRASSAEAKCKDGSNRRAQIKSRVDGGIPIGLIGYMGDQPVAWCSIAPRETYRPLGAPAPDLPPARIRPLPSFSIKPDHRPKRPPAA